MDFRQFKLAVSRHIRESKKYDVIHAVTYAIRYIKYDFPASKQIVKEEESRAFEKKFYRPVFQGSDIVGNQEIITKSEIYVG